MDFLLFTNEVPLFLLLVLIFLILNLTETTHTLLNEKWKRLSYIVFSKFKTLVLLGNKDYITATAKQFEITQ